MADIKEPNLKYTINQMMLECKQIIASDEPEAQKLLSNTLMYMRALSSSIKRLNKINTK